MKRLSLPVDSPYPVNPANVARAEVTTLEHKFDRIMREYGPALSRLATSYEPIPIRREDLLQEIAVAIWQALQHFRGECSERTFLYRIAHNRGLSYAWHRRRVEEPLDEFEAAHDPADPCPHPEEQTAQQHQKKRLLEAIQSLPVGHRQIIMLLLEDLSHSEIAEVLGISENNVGVRLNRARKALKLALGVAS
jgi:RNA polymerase sigma factor (sigma-70 family)